MNTKDFKAFTLVELIVVITILAILGTIAFISLQGFSSDARDSTRISDTSTMKKSLELYYVSNGEYPDPDDSASVNYNSETLWNQGSFGEDVISGVWKNLSEAPLDPLTGEQYTYSLSNTKTEYEILELLESDDLVMNNILVPTANAQDTKVYSKITGNYNGVYLETENYVVPVPSIINAEVTDSDLELDNDNIKSMVVSGEDNVLKVGDVVEETGALDITLSVYNGKITQNNTDEEKEEIITAIQNAYSGSEIENNSNISYILSKTEDEDILELFDNVILNNSSYNGGLNFDICESGELDNYNYLELSHLGTQQVSKITGSGIQSDKYIINSSTVSCFDGNVSIGEESITLYSSCNEILTNNSSQQDKDGIYTIDPENNGTGFDVYCDMTTDGGGWTMVSNTDRPETIAVNGGININNISSGKYQIINSNWNANDILYSCIDSSNLENKIKISDVGNCIVGIFGNPYKYLSDGISGGCDISDKWTNIKNWINTPNAIGRYSSENPYPHFGDGNGGFWTIDNDYCDGNITTSAHTYYVR